MICFTYMLDLAFGMGKPLRHPDMGAGGGLVRLLTFLSEVAFIEIVFVFDMVSGFLILPSLVIIA